MDYKYLQELDKSVPQTPPVLEPTPPKSSFAISEVSPTKITLKRTLSYTSDEAQEKVEHNTTTNKNKPTEQHTPDFKITTTKQEFDRDAGSNDNDLDSTGEAKTGILKSEGVYATINKIAARANYNPSAIQHTIKFLKFLPTKNFDSEWKEYKNQHDDLDESMKKNLCRNLRLLNNTMLKGSKKKLDDEYLLTLLSTLLGQALADQISNTKTTDDSNQAIITKLESLKASFVDLQKDVKNLKDLTLSTDKRLRTTSLSLATMQRDINNIQDSYKNTNDLEQAANEARLDELDNRVSQAQFSIKSTKTMIETVVKTRIASSQTKFKDSILNIIQPTIARIVSTQIEAIAPASSTTSTSSSSNPTSGVKRNFNHEGGQASKKTKAPKNPDLDKLMNYVENFSKNNDKQPFEGQVAKVMMKQHAADLLEGLKSYEETQKLLLTGPYPLATCGARSAAGKLLLTIKKGNKDLQADDEKLKAIAH